MEGGPSRRAARPERRRGGGESGGKLCPGPEKKIEMKNIEKKRPAGMSPTRTSTAHPPTYLFRPRFSVWPCLTIINLSPFFRHHLGKRERMFFMMVDKKRGGSRLGVSGSMGFRCSWGESPVLEGEYDED